jgi:hypothetical protein
VIALDEAAQPIDDHVMLRPANGVALPRHPVKRRPMNSPEDGFLITGGDQPPLLLAAARYEPRPDGGWTIDESIPVHRSHHGGVIVATKDGAVIGCVICGEKQASVFPVAE